MYILVETDTTNIYKFTEINDLYAWVKERVNDTYVDKHTTLIRTIEDVSYNIIVDDIVNEEVAKYFIEKCCVDLDKLPIIAGVCPENIHHENIAHYAYMLYLVTHGKEHNVHLSSDYTDNTILDASIDVIERLFKRHVWIFKRSDLSYYKTVIVKEDYPIINNFLYLCYKHDQNHLCNRYNVVRLMFKHIYNSVNSNKNVSTVFLCIDDSELYDAFIGSFITRIKGEDSFIKSSSLYDMFIEYVDQLYPGPLKSQLESKYTQKAFYTHMKSKGFTTIRKSEGIFYTDIHINGQLTRMTNIDDVITEGNIIPYDTTYSTAGVIISEEIASDL